MSSERQPIERLCPSYATAPLKTIGLSNDGLMLFIFTVVAVRHLIGSSFSLFVAWGFAYFVQRQAEKVGYRDGFLQMKMSVWANSPWMVKHIPIIPKLLAQVWIKNGSIPAAGYKHRFTR
jgi:hypothetical protein